MENITLLAQVNAIEDQQERERLFHELIAAAGKGIEIKTLEELRESIVKANRAETDIEQLRAHSQLELAKKTAIAQAELNASVHYIEDAYFNHQHIERGITGDLASDAVEKLESIIDVVTEFLRPLLPGDRRQLRGMSIGMRRISLVEIGIRLVSLNPRFLPSIVSVEDFETRRNNFERYQKLLSKIRTLQEIISDILLVSSSELYRIVLDFYHIVESYSRSSMPGSEGAKAIYDQLRPFFLDVRHGATRGAAAEGEIDVKIDGKIIEN
jgi:hypothetical protein